MAQKSVFVQTRIMLKIFVKKLLNACGLDIIKQSKNSAYAWLGLRRLPIRTIIDVGANVGQFARTASQAFPAAHIYCFEPLPEAIQALSEWAGKQHHRQITTYNLALGNCEGKVEFFSHIKHSPSSSFLKTTEVCEQLYPFTQEQQAKAVNVSTLDQWFRTVSPAPELEILLKLDVQGFEDRVIHGGQETLKKAKACIVEISLDRLYENQATFQNLSNCFYELGYEYTGNLHQSYADDGHVISIDAIFKRAI